MASTAEYWSPSKTIGKLKISALVISIIAFGLTAAGYNNKSTSEQYVLAITGLAFSVSLIFLLAILLNLIPVRMSGLWKMTDIFYHAFTAFLLTIGVILMAIRMCNHFKVWSKGMVATRFFALIFGSINSGLYGYISLRVYRASV